jgi:phosphate transport system ATP-binding protein
MSGPRAGELSAEQATATAKVSVRELNFFYGNTQALFNISLQIAERVVMAFIGPSGCGKSTFLRTLIRMNDTIPGTRATGEVLLDGADIYAPGVNVGRAMAGGGWRISNPLSEDFRFGI